MNNQTKLVKYGGPRTLFPPIVPAPSLNKFIQEFFNGELLADSLFKDVSPTPYPYNVYEDMDDQGNLKATVVEYALAGVPKDCVSIKVVDDQLMVDIMSNAAETPKTRRSLFQGISRRSSKYTFDLFGVDVSGIKAEFTNGLLQITLPRISPKETTIKITD